MKKLLLSLILGWCLSGPLYAQNLPGFPALEPLTTANVNRLELLAMLGRGRVYDVVWSQDGETVIAATDTGIWLYEAASPLATPRQIVHSLEPVYEIAYTDDGKR